MDPSPRPAGLIQHYREALQTRHCTRSTVTTNEQWLRRCRAFLSQLAVDLQMSASSQNQAPIALLFLRW